MSVSPSLRSSAQFSKQKRLDLGVQLGREGGVLVEGVLEARGQVDLRGLDLREAVEELVGQRGGAVLHGTGQTVLAADLAEDLEGVEVELDLGDAAAGQRHATVRGARLDAHLGEADGVRAGACVELLAVAVQVGAQLVGRGVLLADLADLAADGDDDALVLVGTDERGELRGARVVDLLLLVERFEGEVHERRGVDVDVAVADLHGIERWPCAGSP